MVSRFISGLQGCFLCQFYDSELSRLQKTVLHEEISTEFIHSPVVLRAICTKNCNFYIQKQ
jgi:hypothetical protein